MPTIITKQELVSAQPAQFGSVPTTPDPNTSAEVSRYKWEAYRDTHWWCIYYFLPKRRAYFCKNIAINDRNGNEPLGCLRRVVWQGSAAKWKSLEIPIIAPELLTPSSDLNSQSHGRPCQLNQGVNNQGVSTRGVRHLPEEGSSRDLC